MPALRMPYTAQIAVRLNDDVRKIVFAQVPLTFRLLGPNYRPIQVTADIAGFWQRGYLEVRKELRARYPKHSWPEDPLNARPEAKGRRRS